MGSRLNRETPLDRAVADALERAGLSLKSACERANISLTAVDRWRRGSIAWRDTLQRFTDVLGAPELLGLIPWRWRQITLGCRECGKTVAYPPSRFRYHQRQGRLKDAEVDWASGRGTHICGRCSRAERMRARKARLIKKGGHRLLKAKWPQPRTRTPPPARKGIAHSPEARWLQAVHRIRPQPPGRWGLCRVCGCVTFNRHVKTPRPVETHGVCLRSYQRQRESGNPAYPPRKPSRDRGRILSPEDIAQSFEVAVRHLLKKDPIGELACGTGLAGETGLHENTVNYRINWLLNHLPRDGVGNYRLRFWARALRWARPSTHP